MIFFGGNKPTAPKKAFSRLPHQLMSQQPNADEGDEVQDDKNETPTPLAIEFRVASAPVALESAHAPSEPEYAPAFLKEKKKIVRSQRCLLEQTATKMARDNSRTRQKSLPRQLRNRGGGSSCLRFDAQIILWSFADAAGARHRTRPGIVA